MLPEHTKTYFHHRIPDCLDGVTLLEWSQQVRLHTMSDAVDNLDWDRKCQSRILFFASPSPNTIG